MAINLIKQVMLKPSEKSKLVDQDALIEKIKEGYTVNRVSKHVQKKTFAPSTIAYGFGECARYWYLAFDGNTFDDYSDAYGVANMTAGTLSHDRIQNAMLASGLAIPYVNDKGETTTEFKVIASDPPIFGYGDVMLNWEGEELLGEIKTMPSEGFEYRRTSGKAKTGHLIQILIYMKILNKKKAVLIYENKNNHDLLVFPVEMNESNTAWINYAFDWLRETRQAWVNRTIPKKNYRSNSKICKTCPVRKACDAAEPGELKIAALEEPSEAM